MSLKRVFLCFWVTLGGSWLPYAGAHTVSVTLTSPDGTPLDYSAVFFEPLSFKPKAVSKDLPAVVISQKKQMFLPAITMLQTGTRVEFPNLDTVRHHVYSFSEAKTFDIKLYLGRAPSSELFDQSGVVALGCNIHDTMIAWVVVVDTPYFALTDKLGNATVDLPAGDYQLKVWDRRQIDIPNDGQRIAVTQNQSFTVSTDVLDFDPYTDVTGESVDHIQTP
ncbi:methylamine utilization protein [Marinomonas sp. RS-M-Aa-14]|uniref:methylamine utilization protein n=1 Tax=Marinomonas sp. RS-M-Aa-14 TaxID=3241169 RepID=UPI00390CB900